MYYNEPADYELCAGFQRVIGITPFYLTACRKAWLRETLHGLYSAVPRSDLASFPGSTSQPSAFRIVLEAVEPGKEAR